MKTKKWIVGLGLSIVGFVVIVIFTFIVANASDVDLHRDVAACLEHQPVISPTTMRASDQMRELKVPLQSEPKLCGSRAWCRLSEIQKSELAEYIEFNASYLEKFKQLVALQDYSSDAKAVPTAKGVFNFLKLSNLQRREWNLRLAKSPKLETAKSIATEMQTLNQLLTNALKNPQTLIEAQVFLLVLKSNRNFLTEGAKAEPKFRRFFEAPEFQSVTSANPNLSFEKTARTVRDQELRGLANLLKRPLTYSSLGLADFDDETKKSQPPVFTWLADAVVNHGFLVNDSLNRHYESYNLAIERVEQNLAVLEAFPRHSYFLNPRNILGRNLVAILGGRVQENFYQMQRSLQVLQKPVSFD